jgi:hypothetical protein
VGLVLPDGQAVEDEWILSGKESEHPFKADTEENNFFYTFADPEQATKPLGPMACRPPSNWSVVRTSTVRGTTVYPLSHVWGPQRVDETVTLKAEWTVTKGYEIEVGVGWSIGVLEAQTHAKLDGSITTSMSESQTFKVAKGTAVHLVAQIIYRQTDLRRNSYAGPNCQPHPESGTVLTPISYATLIARAH